MQRKLFSLVKTWAQNSQKGQLHSCTVGIWRNDKPTWATPSTCQLWVDVCDGQLWVCCVSSNCGHMEKTTKYILRIQSKEKNSNLYKNTVKLLKRTKKKKKHRLIMSKTWFTKKKTYRSHRRLWLWHNNKSFVSMIVLKWNWEHR